MRDTIRVCDNPCHSQHVPLIWTFAFPGCEWWCAVCGMAGGMLGTGQDVADTPELDERLADLETRTAEYLKARGKLVAERIPVNGVKLHRSEVPMEIFREARAVVDAWAPIDESTLYSDHDEHEISK